ncbi:diadenylate cyclase, partial [Bacillus sp. SS-TM]
MPFEDTTILKYLSTALDIAIVWFIIYKLILIIRGTKAVQLLKGITVIIVVKMISIFLELRTLSWLTEQVLTWGFLAVIIIFQPELRRALEQLGRGSLFSRVGTHEDDEPEMVATAIAKATEYMGKRRIGALITLSKETGMGDY